MLKGDQMTPGDGHWDSYLVCCYPHAFIQPQVRKATQERYAKAEPAIPWKEIGCITWCGEVSLCFMGLNRLTREAAKKGKAILCPGIL